MKHREYVETKQPVQITLGVLRETPAIRVYSVGAGALSLLELLGAVLSSADTALSLLSRFSTLEGIGQANAAELEQVRGIGRAGVARLKAALELGRRLVTPGVQDRPAITCPADAASLLLAEMSALEQEQMRVILLDTRNRVQAVQVVYHGSVNTIMVRVAELFREAVRANCASIIVAHCHPSGDPSPSPEDVAITRDMVSAGRLLSIGVLDHLVVAKGRWVSLKERGLGFS